MQGILLHNVSYTYPNGTQAINNISLKINSGETVGILGANGAGKSTFMKLINGLLLPSSGEVFVDGKTTREYDLSVLTRKVGVMFQNPEHQLFKSSVSAEIDYSLGSLNLSDLEARDYKIKTIKSLELDEIIDRSPFHLSGGERKKASMATILCRQTEYLLFDEPTVGQDRKQRKILEKVIQTARDEGKTIIIISHDTEFTYRNVERMIIFRDGEVLADGPPDELLSSSKIIEKTNLLQPQIMLLLEKLKVLWQNKTGNREFPLEVDKISRFDQLEENLLEIFSNRIVKKEEDGK